MQQKSTTVRHRVCRQDHRYKHRQACVHFILTNNDVLKDVGIVVRCSCHCGTEKQNKKPYQNCYSLNSAQITRFSLYKQRKTPFLSLPQLSFTFKCCCTSPITESVPEPFQPDSRIICSEPLSARTLNRNTLSTHSALSGKTSSCWKAPGASWFAHSHWVSQHSPTKQLMGTENTVRLRKKSLQRINKTSNLELVPHLRLVAEAKETVQFASNSEESLIKTAQECCSSLRWTSTCPVQKAAEATSQMFRKLVTHLWLG